MTAESTTAAADELALLSTRLSAPDAILEEATLDADVRNFVAQGGDPAVRRCFFYDCCLNRSILHYYSFFVLDFDSFVVEQLSWPRAHVQLVGRVD
jgi:hypothetical protein